LGTGGFVATVKDSASHITSEGFTITVTTPLEAQPPQSFSVRQFSEIPAPLTINSGGGVQPLTYSLAGGALPRGLRLDPQRGFITGTDLEIGNFTATVNVQDSFSPPEVVAQQITIQAIAPNLTVADSLPRQILLNRPFTGRVIATGGIPPYTFTMTTGSVPPGLSSIDPSSGQVSGTPTTVGSYFYAVQVADSSPTPLTASTQLPINVTAPLGRNDTVATSTPTGNGSITASISPYIDPPGSAPLPSDSDYYKLVSLSGATVHVETFAGRNSQSYPLDTVIEIVDGNSTRFSTCRQPGDTGPTFASLCLNDDISAQNRDSALDFQVPGSPNTPKTFYVHVLDWRGDARPDMVYILNVGGMVVPLSVQSTPLLPAAHNRSYSQQLNSANGIGSVSWTLASGTLPPGLMLSPSGLISGNAISDGNYSFVVKGTDSGNPPQTATAQESIQVAEPIAIVSSSPWPDACINQPYSFTIQTSGGVPPLQWSFFSSNWIDLILNQSTGVFSGTPDLAGTFTGTVGVIDGTGQTNGASQQVTVTVKQCP